MGSIEQPINNSKGCGGVMRAAPCGLVDHGDAFLLGCEVAAITHGHPSGYLTAGCLASIVHDLLQEIPLDDAIRRVLTRVSSELQDEITQLADDVLIGYRDGDEWWRRYPGC